MTTGDANRPLAVEAVVGSPHASSGSHAETDHTPQHAGSVRRAAQESRQQQNGNSAGEPSTSGRPEQLSCRLIVDCMVRALPDFALPYLQLPSSGTA